MKTSKAALPLPVDTVIDDDIMDRQETKGMIADPSDATFWRMYTKGDFPRPVSISSNRVGWLRSEVKAWIAARAAARRSTSEDKAAA